MSQSNHFPNQDGGFFLCSNLFIECMQMWGNNREEMKWGWTQKERQLGGGQGGRWKKTQRSSRKDLRLRNGTRKNESRGGRRSPSRKRSIQKLNSASSSKIRIQQRGVTAQERLDWQGERFSSSRKGNKKYRWGQRLTGRQMNYVFFFLSWITLFDSPEMFFSVTCGFITQSTCQADMLLSPVVTRGFSDFEKGGDLPFFGAHLELFFFLKAWGE